MYYKYPRTNHFSWSLGSTNDDKFHKTLEPFIGMQVVNTEKMDGENSNIYNDKFHARSLDSNDHESRHWLKGLWGTIKNEIPDGWRICGENLYAKHSIYYDDLDSYFKVFSIWDENNMCLSWDDTLMICESLNLKTVREISRGIFDEAYLRDLANNIDLNKIEGYVTRNINSFHYDDFNKNVGKMVRKGHVQTDQHWMYNKIIPNKLKQ